MTDYSKLSDREIDSLVLNVIYGVHAHDKDINACWVRGGFKYTNNWLDAGTIIIQHGISIAFDKNEDEWVAFGDFAFDLAGWDMKEQPAKYQHDKNPLRAAMIVFLQMQENK